jgi:hypothetical protein
MKFAEVIFVSFTSAVYPGGYILLNCAEASLFHAFDAIPQSWADSV